MEFMEILMVAVIAGVAQVTIFNLFGWNRLRRNYFAFISTITASVLLGILISPFFSFLIMPIGDTQPSELAYVEVPGEELTYVEVLPAKGMQEPIVPTLVNVTELPDIIIQNNTWYDTSGYSTGSYGTGGLIP